MIGIAIETCEKCLSVSAKDATKDEATFPYSIAIQGDVVFNALKRLDQNLNIFYENYEY